MPHRTSRKNNLLKKDPHCYYCGIEVGIYNLNPHEKTPDNMAGVHTQYSRYTDKRNATDTPRERTVLACAKCIKQKSKEEQDSIPLEKKRELAQNNRNRNKPIDEKYKGVIKFLQMELNICMHDIDLLKCIEPISLATTYVKCFLSNYLEEKEKNENHNPILLTENKSE